LDPRRSVTPDEIELKFGMRDYDVGATQHAKPYNNRPGRDPEVCPIPHIAVNVSLKHVHRYRHRTSKRVQAKIIM